MKLVVEQVGKRFGERVILKDVCLSVRENEFVCILGHSGCGKSTLLNMVAGYLFPDEGAIRVDGRTVEGPSKSRGMVFQDHALFPWYSVLENVAFGPEVQGMPRPKARELAAEFLSLVGLESYAAHYPAELSGGMKQRVGIARALASRPDILLMDEPFGALDILTRDMMQRELRSIYEKLKPTILFVTHSISEAVSLADRVVVMKHGVIADTFEIGIPHPRSYDSPGFGEYMARIEKLLMDTGEGVPA
ncbi:ABC transporter ATP-binding protein [Paenibacillus mucilaginosus]|uniref:Carnitine transport ATP-binding protein OpuCA n=2 Tax=Paenibacillus mucilaginosus TaxID=61624 RepID=H6NRJ5_9BACL|nr:ABC transporter ATP-binding protein [Paenibacillus mucilaginosus]AEI38971.1 nitrate/sulfonate/bicarbonate ABC transporter ATP-binding protein [Paenibacillus mucilaginosus KNP414]AFC27277.1 nitrate/sulfonate/bicarbonate ABC transporter ATP-binding protein [Paenibacillus mucilaginosus 3016]MCG7216591.1 ABC transporter ATP-binding protein [Paenibacillus mucilaginosus]WDM28015.1 ABC transporter ATP-binding protein [Paenibacillus mucilaginosus]WFA16191.1 ABC transporter ATP-binding protein [Paen